MLFVRRSAPEFMKKSPLLVIFLTVFIDLIGFGIVLPLLPIYSDQFGAGGLLIGIIMASFSAMQFVFAPAWGHLSDRIGRRPVLLVSTAGAVASYALFAVGSGLTQAKAALAVILLSRVLAGVFGASSLHCRYRTAGPAIQENGADWNGLWARIHFRPCFGLA
jgi:MFS family permease